MTSFKLGLGWDTNVDVDGSVLLLDKDGNTVENIYYGNLKSKNGSVIHSGDDTSG